MFYKQGKEVAQIADVTMFDKRTALCLEKTLYATETLKPHSGSEVRWWEYHYLWLFFCLRAWRVQQMLGNGA